ncbi:MAG: hypothetical protein ABI883_01415, partial [Chthoniobacterales bacterium]
SEANIRRIDSKPKAKKQTHGFQVHFLRGASAVTRMFSDTIYAGKEGARRAARKFKRSAMANLPDRVFAGPVRRKTAAKKSGGVPARGKAKTKPAGSRKTARPAAKKSSSARKSKSR